MNKIETVCFSGGGMKCVSYIGIIQVLEKMGAQPSRFIGASGGAMTALMYGLGYTSDEMFDFSRHSKAKYKVRSCGWCGVLCKIFKTFGAYRTTALQRDVCDLLLKRGFGELTTFQEYYQTTGRDLILVGTNLSRKRAEYFSVQTTPDMPISTAVVVSSSLPLFFEPVRYNGNVYTDGGLCDNFPINVIFDPTIATNVKSAKNTLGFLIVDSNTLIVQNEMEQKTSVRMEELEDYASCLVDTLMTQNMENQLKRTWSEIRHNIFLFSVDGIKTTDLHADEHVQHGVIETTRKEFEKFLEQRINE